MCGGTFLTTEQKHHFSNFVYGLLFLIVIHMVPLYLSSSCVAHSWPCLSLFSDSMGIYDCSILIVLFGSVEVTCLFQKFVFDELCQRLHVLVARGVI